MSRKYTIVPALDWAQPLLHHH